MDGRLKNIFKAPKDFSILRLKKDQLLIILLTGILLLIIAIPSGDRESEDDGNNNTETYTSGTSGGTYTDNDYVAWLESRLAEVLSQIEGAGDVTVMITLNSSAEKIIEKDLEINDENITESDSQGGSRTTNNTSHGETTVYSSSGDNGEEPYVSKEISPKVEGVLVIAAGGGNAVVKENITEAVQALFDIDTHKIRIMKKNENK